jgi:hypothetical protein
MCVEDNQDIADALAATRWPMVASVTLAYFFPEAVAVAAQLQQDAAAA